MTLVDFLWPFPFSAQRFRRFVFLVVLVVGLGGDRARARDRHGFASRRTIAVRKSAALFPPNETAWRGATVHWAEKR